MKFYYGGAAHPNQISILKWLFRFHSYIVDSRTVAAADIGNPKMLTALFNLGMIARHIEVILERDGIVECPANGQEAVIQQHLACRMARLNHNEFSKRHLD
jgi:hypothetical protein